MKKLIHTENNSFIVDTEAEINFNDFYISGLSNKVLQRTKNMDIVETTDNKILYSLHKISDDIPLFEIVEDDVEDKIYQAIGLSANEQGIINQALATKKVLEIYNQAKATKGYSEEDILIIRNKFVAMMPVGDITAWDCIEAMKNYTLWFDEYIQFLNQKEQEVEVVKTIWYDAELYQQSKSKLTKEGKVQIKLK